MQAPERHDTTARVTAPAGTAGAAGVPMSALLASCAAAHAVSTPPRLRQTDTRGGGRDTVRRARAA